ncbi:hypothetical protein T4C_2447 [Trichinella pseudospiralis]|uniref:Uncharacterized protein n=1 Tax=Trichinella pseudospiralis TaxID=6337 RepID=A0A0V1GRV9_TRIPS|nr:hypothetical protein T4C_2447 [Trichinella pseudospiralis]
MAFYKGLSEKSKIKTSEAPSMAFYKGILCRSASHFVILKDKDKRSSFNGILQGIE